MTQLPQMSRGRPLEALAPEASFTRQLQPHRGRLMLFPFDRRAQRIFEPRIAEEIMARAICNDDPAVGFGYLAECAESVEIRYLRGRIPMQACAGRFVEVVDAI